MLQFVRNRLKEHGKTATQLAEEMGIKRVSLYGELKGDMRLSTLLRIARHSDYYLCFHDKETKKFYVITEKELWR